MSKEFIDAMNDDLNLPNVTSHLYLLIKSNSQLLREKNFKLVNKNINTAIKELEILGFVVKTISGTDPLLTK
jgi:cysteinyl-tRNA synthetase